ncbi:uncharacterized protein LOC127120522 isoform X2 [Lathyrus oleraceus]|nr:uncharacterized protein LOC127120522 isoform X2 [Pisum sativum]
MGNQVTKEHIDLYFFAKDVNSYLTYYRGLMDYITNNDLALKANLDGADLLIFPSKVLPKESQYSSNFPFFWGVFKERKANYSTNSNTQISNALESANGDKKKYRSFNLNAVPEDVDDETEVAEILGSDSKSGTRNAHVEESEKDMKNTRYCSQVTAPALTAAPASASTAAPASAAPASVAPSNVHLHHTGQERNADSEKQIIQVNSKKEFTSRHMGDALSGRVQTLAKAERYMDRNVEATSYVASDYSLTKCVSALEEIQDISDDIYGKALKKFKDPDWREMFIAMSDDRKRGWLLRL